MRPLVCKPTCIRMLCCKKSGWDTQTHTSLSVLWTLRSAVTIKPFSRNSLLYYITPHSWHSISRQTVCFPCFSLTIFVSSPPPNNSLSWPKYLPLELIQILQPYMGSTQVAFRLLIPTSQYSASIIPTRWRCGGLLGYFNVR